MNWIEHMQAAANHFHEEIDQIYRGMNIQPNPGHKAVQKELKLIEAATKDAKAIEQLIDDIENGKTQEPSLGETK